MISIPIYIAKCIIVCWLTATLVPLTSCTAIRYKLYFANSFPQLFAESALQRFQTSHDPNLISNVRFLCDSKRSVQFRGPASLGNNLPPPPGEELLALWRNCNYPPYMEAVTSIRNPRTHHTMMTWSPEIVMVTNSRIVTCTGHVTHKGKW
jgi:hypothetical protein